MPASSLILRVLVVDDEEVIADSMAAILKNNGYHAKAVYSAESAIEESVLMAPDVLISDVIMGGMSGIDLAIHITNTVPTCKIILFSGLAATANLLRNAETQGYRFELLTKPLHPQLILERLAEYTKTLAEMGGLELHES